MTDIKQKALASIPEATTAVINGKAVQGDGDTIFEVINPTDETKVLDLVGSDAEYVDRAVQAARKRFEQGAWSHAPIQARQEVLFKTAELIQAHREELAALDTLCVGLPYYGSTLGQTQAAANWFHYFGELIGTANDELYQQLPNTITLVTHDPVGVVGIFPPWNIPLYSAALKTSAALAMGNSCVIKPSSQSPLSALRFVELLYQAGLPEGVVNLVNGSGSVTGAALAGHRDINLISFTGGGVAGRLIATQAAQRFAKVTMELGGKSGNIIFDDASYERALDTALLAVYANNGQICLAGSRILVQNTIAERFISDFVKRAENIRIGDPFNPETELGPLSSKGHMEQVLSYVNVARSEGVKILTGGNRPNGFDKGYYIKPIVVLAKDNRLRVCQEEVFGPFATILTFDTEEEAISMANDTQFGLVAYLWTENVARALRVSEALRAGTILVNTPIQREKNAPFGGFKHSGIDREGGKWSLRFYSEAKTTIIPYQEFPITKFGAER